MSGVITISTRASPGPDQPTSGSIPNEPPHTVK